VLRITNASVTLCAAAVSGLLFTELLETIEILITNNLNLHTLHFSHANPLRRDEKEVIMSFFAALRESSHLSLTQDVYEVRCDRNGVCRGDKQPVTDCRDRKICSRIGSATARFELR
jgi:hypothetical protein